MNGIILACIDAKIQFISSAWGYTGQNYTGIDSQLQFSSDSLQQQILITQSTCFKPFVESNEFHTMIKDWSILVPMMVHVSHISLGCTSVFEN